jgi:repressor of nif and glnA expression
MSEITIMNTLLKFVNHSIEDYAMQVTFDPASGEGRVVYNLSLIKNEDLDFAISMLKDAYQTGVTVSGRVRFLSAGEKIADFVVPKGFTGICTICSVTFDGLLIRHGIPINPIGGGIVEIEKRTPMRFTHIILYEYTTIDPLQVLSHRSRRPLPVLCAREAGPFLQISGNFTWKPNLKSVWCLTSFPVAVFPGF